MLILMSMPMSMSHQQTCPPLNQQNQTELIHSIYTIEGLPFQLDIKQDIYIILLTQ